MNIKALRYFCAVVEAGSARLASERLHIAPTAISMQISQLEEQLGGKLFHRHSRPMGLTQLGHFLHSKGREILQSLERLESEAQGIAAGIQGWLGIGFTRSTLFSVLPEAVRVLQTELAQVRFDLQEILTEHQPGALRAGTIHVGIARWLGPMAEEPDLHSELLFNDPLVAVVPRHHPLAGQAFIRAADLQALPYICYPQLACSHFSRTVLTLLQQAGARLHIGHEAQEIHTALALVAAGLGTTVVGRSVAIHARPDLCFLPLADVSMTSQVMAITLGGPSSALVERFLDVVRRQSALHQLQG